MGEDDLPLAPSHSDCQNQSEKAKTMVLKWLVMKSQNPECQNTENTQSSTNTEYT
jgi:hypothetical protein